MKKLLTLLMLILVNNIHSQTNLKYDIDYKKNVSNESYNSSLSLYDDEIIYSDKYRYELIVNPKDKSLDILKYDIETNERLSIKQLDFPSKSLYEYSIHLKGGKHFYKYSRWDKENEKEQLFIKEYDLEKGVYIGDEQLIIESDKIKNKAIYGGSMGTGFFLKFPHIVNLDSTKVIFVYKKVPKSRSSKKNIDSYEVTIFDEELIELSNNKYNMPKVERDIELKEIFYFNDKVTFLISDKSSDAKSSLAYLILDEGSIKRIDLNVQDIDLKTFKSVINDGVLYLVGFTFDKTQDFLFLSSLEENNKIKSKLINLENNFIRPYFKCSKNDYKVQIDDIIVNDNEIVLVSEIHVKISQRERDYIHNYWCPSQLLILKYNLDFQTKFESFIPKKQFEGQSDSYGFFKKDGYYYFFYMNNPKNISLEMDAKPYLYKTNDYGNLEVAIVDPNGEITRKKILNTEDENISVYPKKYTINSDENSISFKTFKDGKRVVLNISIN